MAIKTKSIKVSERAHQQLRLLAVKYEAHVWEVVDMAVVALKVEEQRAKSKNGRPATGKGEGSKR